MLIDFKHIFLPQDGTIFIILLRLKLKTQMIKKKKKRAWLHPPTIKYYNYSALLKSISTTLDYQVSRTKKQPIIPKHRNGKVQVI